MEKMRIRRACIDDIEAIAGISRTTWDGEDYLEEKAAEWITDRSLFTGELEGEVVGTFRISSMPDKVLWMEGLRIHIDHRGTGLGRELADAAFETARKIIEKGEAECIEFSTYVLNHESIHISRTQGFRLVNRFMLLFSDNIKPSSEVQTFKPSSEDFQELRDHIPCGWKYPRLSSDGIKWALERCDAFRTGQVSFLKKRNSVEAAPLKGAIENPDAFLDAVEAAAFGAVDSRSCIVVHHSGKPIIERAYERGYISWDPVDECNVLIFRYTV